MSPRRVFCGTNAMCWCVSDGIAAPCSTAVTGTYVILVPASSQRKELDDMKERSAGAQCNHASDIERQAAQITALERTLEGALEAARTAKEEAEEERRRGLEARRMLVEARRREAELKRRVEEAEVRLRTRRRREKGAL